MDPALLREREAFKKRNLAATEKKVAKPKPPPSSTGATVKKKKDKKAKKHSLFTKKRYNHSTGINEEITKAAELAFRNDNPARIFKAVVDLMKERYLSKVFEPLNLEEILSSIHLSELKTDRREWLYQSLKGNPKIHYYSEVDKFIYLPCLGHDVKNRKNLLEYLKKREREGLGGLAMGDVVDSIPHAQKAIKKLGEDIIKVPPGFKEKDEILFYNNKDYQLNIGEEFVSYWRGIAVDGQSEGDIEKYLQNVGLSAMQGESRKRKAPNASKKARKKARPTKVLNTHLDLLKDYSDDGTQVTTPTTQ